MAHHIVAEVEPRMERAAARHNPLAVVNATHTHLAAAAVVRIAAVVDTGLAEVRHTAVVAEEADSPAAEGTDCGRQEVGIPGCIDLVGGIDLAGGILEEVGNRAVAGVRASGLRTLVAAVGTVPVAEDTGPEADIDQVEAAVRIPLQHEMNQQMSFVFLSERIAFTHEGRRMEDSLLLPVEDRTC